jgi:hypothetical protein
VAPPPLNRDEDPGGSAALMADGESFFHNARGPDKTSGMLDRTDSICFAAPVFFHIVRFFYSA